MGVGCVDFSFVAAALWLWWWPSFLAFPAGFGGFGWDCGGVVCELDSVFVFCFYACFLFLSIFLVGIACHVFCGGFSGLIVFTVLFGEFDPGSGRTLAACLTHASRTLKAQLAGLDEWRTGE